MRELSDTWTSRQWVLRTLSKGHKQVHRAEDPLAKEARVSEGPIRIVLQPQHFCNKPSRHIEKLASFVSPQI